MSYNQYGGGKSLKLMGICSNLTVAGNPYGAPPAYGGYGNGPPGMGAPPGLGSSPVSSFIYTC